MSPATRHTLIERLQGLSQAEEDRIAFAAIYLPLIQLYARQASVRITRAGRPEADDAAQEVVTMVLGGGTTPGKIITFDVGKGKSFRAWLRRITRNEVVNQLRKQKLPLPEGFDPSADDPTDAERDRAEQVFLVERAVEHLRQVGRFSTNTWAVFDNWFAAQTSGRRVTYAELGEPFGLTARAVQHATDGVCDRLKEYLGDDFLWN